MPDDPRTIPELLAPFRTALLATRGEDGHLRCRPMAMRQTVRGEELWFATARDSTKCRDLEHDPRCALVFFAPEDGTTVTVSGTGEVIRDRKLMTELWDPSWSRWFPDGPDPRQVALIRVIPELVERHDGATGRTDVPFSAPPRKRGR
ncbi:pyridoxamine 5'-phosphate oxidase family protein [Anaeromyxobacter oryzisoli]|jgi:general stress protein 26|uniref:pyridoxamine 5'-phosphate oxidase family protein n=1 Tax=Anaeromyxobacter oryzisoli TaxID=2925408 RepID=UPI001F56A19F|nr:pyridoxamine 5'-phosphate oxidase family protein [Anaeromyxobacter sp. SG63]